MNITTMALGDYQTNCYMVCGQGEECVVIDPGYTPERVLRAVREMGKTVAAVFLTHGHFDHVGGVKAIAEETGCRVYLCKEELSMPEAWTAGPLYYTHLYGEGDTVEIAGLSFRVLQTPGHTPGSVCITCEDAMFSGDTLFWGSCGRTDLPGGDWATIVRSLKRLAAMAGDYTVYPGHGQSTRLSQERVYNPYMR